MSSTEATRRRSYGTGSLDIRTDANGRQTWIARWRDDGRQRKQAIGPVRVNGAKDGLTRQ